MRRVALCVAAVALTAVPARALDRILYATANSQDKADGNRVDGFCLRKDGGLAPTPTVRVQTTGRLPRRNAGRLPRRLLVGRSADGSTSTMLYVAERDRVEAYPIDGRGRLGHPKSTRILARRNLGFPRDLALSPDGSILYVSLPLLDRVLAYPLDAKGAPLDLNANGVPISPTDPADSGRPLTCVQGRADSRYDSVIATESLLYASAAGTSRVEIYGLDSGSIASDRTYCSNSDQTTENCPSVATFRVSPVQGKQCLEATADACSNGTCRIRTSRSDDACTQPPCPPPLLTKAACSKDADCLTIPISERTRLQGARSMILNGGVLYVEETFARRVSSFALKSGLFNPPKPRDTKHKDKLQQRRGRTVRGSGYYDALLIVPTAEAAPLAASTLFGTQFFRGRIDAYALPADGMLPMRPKRPLKARVRTKEDPKTSPVRLAADQGALYVAAGALDRVQAYRLRTADGMLKSTTPFSVTDEQAGSFPNDVAVAVLSGNCR